jgi:glutaredoxin 3
MSDAKQVIVYSAPWCGFCHATKQYLLSKGVEFVEKDVDADPAFAAESVEKSGQMGIPVIDIDGSIVVGFDRPTIDRLLKK